MSLFSGKLKCHFTVILQLNADGHTGNFVAMVRNEAVPESKGLPMDASHHTSHSLFMIADQWKNIINHYILQSGTVVRTAAPQQEACEFVSGPATRNSICITTTS